jgi:hypothetical protein
MSRRYRWVKRPWHDAVGAVLLLGLLTVEGWLLLAGWGRL